MSDFTAHLDIEQHALSLLYYRERNKSMCNLRQIISIPVALINTQSVLLCTCLTTFFLCSSVGHIIINMHTFLIREANLFSLQKRQQRMCWGDFCHSSSLFHVPHLECTTSEYLPRSGQDHLCPLETCCVPVGWNNEETNFLFCQSYVNHVIRKPCQNTLQEERKGGGGDFILRKYWSFTAFIVFDCHIF